MDAIRIFKEAVRLPAEPILRVYLGALSRATFDPERVNRILVFAYHGLGNFIMYTPALRLLRERYPHARIDLQVGNNTGCEDVLEGAGLFDNIYDLPYTAGLSAWLNSTERMITVTLNTGCFCPGMPRGRVVE